MSNGISRTSRIAVGLLFAASLNAAHACSVCFGKSDTALAKGLHWGVIALLAVVLSVLASIAAFFFYLARRSAAVAAGNLPATESVPETTQRI